MQNRLKELGIYILLVLGLANIGIAQNAQLSNSPKIPYAPYGGVFTPKGTLRVLLVFVTYKDKSASNPTFENKNYNLPNWDYSTNNKLPNFVNSETGACPEYIFNTEADFEQKMDLVSNNFSKEFSLMSNGKFKMIGEVFTNVEGKPTVVEIDPTEGYSWTNMNGRAVEAMQKINPKMNYARFDQRQNSPNFRFDNSDTTKHKPDKIIDFVVFVHRYNKNWKEQPKRGMRAWIGSTGGFAATGVHPQNKMNGYSVSEGFTMTYNTGVFIHEVAHVLFNAPHIMGVNNVVGNHFQLLSAGWGVMAPISIFGGFNAWERWYAGFIELVADIQSPKEVAPLNVFLLRDFFTTGDAMRIKIPFAKGQYLWLENHAKLHPLDEHSWSGKVLGEGDTVASAAKGIYAYVEDIEGSRNVIFSALSNRANGIKVLHAGGNYDYQMYENMPDRRNNWGNVMKSFRRLEANPISGSNNLYRFPYDKNKDGMIKLDPNYNSSKTEWYAPIFREEIRPDSFVNLYGSFGVYDLKKAAGYVGPIAYRDGGYLDVNSNPMPLNYPKYNLKNKKLAPYVLNGLALKFSSIENSTDMLVEVRFEQVKLCQHRRWAGDIELPNITKDERADLEISACTQLVLNKSGMANTHVQTAAGDFINSTVFTIKKGATLHLKEKSKLILEDDTILIVEEGGKIILDNRAQIVVQSKATFAVEEGMIQQHKGAKVIRKGQK